MRLATVCCLAALTLACAGAPPEVDPGGDVTEGGEEPPADEAPDTAEPEPEPEPEVLPDLVASAPTQEAARAGLRAPRGPTVGLLSCDPVSGPGLFLGSPASLAPVLDRATDCYAQALAESPGAEGLVAVSFTVTPEGRTSRPRILPGQAVAPAVGQCTLAALEEGAVDSPPEGGQAQVLCRLSYRP